MKATQPLTRCQRVALRLSAALVLFALVPLWYEWPIEVHRPGDTFRIFLCPTLALLAASAITFLTFLLPLRPQFSEEL